MMRSAEMTFPNLAPAHAERPHCLAVAGASDVGKVRERNEDHFVVAELGRYVRIESTNFEDPRRRDRVEVPCATLLGVADGMGGHAGGQMASASALDTVVGDVVARFPHVVGDTDEDRRALLQHMAQMALDAQERVQATATRKGVVGGHPGTTLTVALLYGRRALLMHVGDSRAYLVRGGQATRLTHDHTVGEQMRARGIEVSSRFDGVLVNAIGGSSEAPTPELVDLALEEGDTLVLLTDGVTGYLADAELGPLVSRHEASPEGSQAICAAMIATALDRGGGDNATVVVARVVRSAGA